MADGKNALVRTDGFGEVIDDIDKVATGTSNALGNITGEANKLFSGAAETAGAAFTTAATGVQNFGNTMVGVNKATDTTFNGSEASAGGAAGYFEREAAAKLAAQEQKKQSSKNLFTRFLDVQDDAFNKFEQQHGLTGGKGKDDGFSFG